MGRARGRAGAGDAARSAVHRGLVGAHRRAHRRRGPRGPRRPPGPSGGRRLRSAPALSVPDRLRHRIALELVCRERGILTARQPRQRAETPGPRPRPGQCAGPGPRPAPPAATPATHLNLPAPLTRPHPPRLKRSRKIRLPRKLWYPPVALIFRGSPIFRANRRSGPHHARLDQARDKSRITIPSSRRTIAKTAADPGSAADPACPRPPGPPPGPDPPRTTRRRRPEQPPAGGDRTRQQHHAITQRNPRGAAPAPGPPPPPRAPAPGPPPRRGRPAPPAAPRDHPAEPPQSTASATTGNQNPKPKYLAHTTLELGEHALAPFVVVAVDFVPVEVSPLRPAHHVQRITGPDHHVGVIAPPKPTVHPP